MLARDEISSSKEKSTITERSIITIDDLPEECLFLILLYTPPSQWSELMLVSSQFYGIMKDPVFSYRAAQYYFFTENKTHFLKAYEDKYAKISKQEAFLLYLVLQEKNNAQLFTRPITLNNLYALHYRDSTLVNWTYYQKNQQALDYYFQHIINPNFKRKATFYQLFMHCIPQLIHLTLSINLSIIDALDKFGNTLLHWAVLCNQVKIVQALIDQGFNVNKVNFTKKSPLFLAADCGNLEVAQLLLDAGASVNSRDNKGLKPLHQAAQNGHEEMVKLLLQYGAKVNSSTYSGMSSLMIASQKGHAAVVKTLLAHNANIDAFYKENGATALYFAAKKNHLSVVIELLAKQADIECICFDGTTPLIIAASKGHFAIVKALLIRKANPNKCAMDMSPLFQAAMEGHEAIVNELLDYGADINFTIEDENTTPLLIAIQKGNTPTVRLLLQRGANIKASLTANIKVLLEFAAGRQKTETVEDLLIGKFGISLPGTIPEFSALELAAFFGHIDIVVMLIKQFPFTKKTIELALAWATAMEHIDIQQELEAHLKWLINSTENLAREKNTGSPQSFFATTTNNSASITATSAPLGSTL